MKFKFLDQVKKMLRKRSKSDQSLTPPPFTMPDLPQVQEDPQPHSITEEKSAPLNTLELYEKLDGKKPESVPPPIENLGMDLSAAPEEKTTFFKKKLADAKNLLLQKKSKSKTANTPDLKTIPKRKSLSEFTHTALVQTKAFGPKLKKFAQSNEGKTAGTLATLTLCSYFLSDIVGILVDQNVPSPPEISMRSRLEPSATRIPTLYDFDVIVTRNLFNQKGLIPGEDQNPAAPSTLPPVKTSLPLNLVGTLVLRDELKSIATVEDKANSQVYPIRITEEIPSKIRVTQIEPKRVIFVNLQNMRNEFVEIPEDPAEGKFAGIQRRKNSESAGVELVNENRFVVQRTKIDEATSNMAKVLTEARAIPHFENGAASGFKLIQIVPGSIYDQLGLKNNDVLKKFDGQSIDPATAFQYLQSIKEKNQISITVNRGGRDMTMTYDLQ